MLLRDKDKDRLIALFAEIIEPVEVWAYGSRVSGTAHAGSDLDLVLRSQSLDKVSIETLKELKEKIRESNIPIIVELFDWARLPESFHNNIMANYEILFSNIIKMASEPGDTYQKPE